jgi:tRNA A37 threonylcarbamoyladenosine biosynthesis protein TsaE
MASNFIISTLCLDDAGIVGNELAEVEEDADAVVAVEWGEVVHNILPSSRVVVTIAATDEEDRKITFEYPDSYSYLFQKA